MKAELQSKILKNNRTSHLSEVEMQCTAPISTGGAGAETESN